MSNRKSKRQHSYSRCGSCGNPISKSEFHMNAVKFDELQNYIEVVEDKKAKVSDIPDFLKEMCEEEE